MCLRYHCACLRGPGKKFEHLCEACHVADDQHDAEWVVLVVSVVQVHLLDALEPVTPNAGRALRPHDVIKGNR